MGGEGHMLDMIKKMELNRTQRKDARGERFKSSSKPQITEEYIQNIENFKIELPDELSPKQKRKYKILAVLALIFIIGVGSYLIVAIFS